ncbi:hypothetical protein [Archangium sp.]|uniref:hypothetical protein n=1 Tax=Archangium sp. TaxID=1872627 RepID=UPI002D7342EA|nr:hypothetical protein [Archangium sp.]HYO53576.1 hypothetical protein [Archangium sp.]
MALLVSKIVGKIFIVSEARLMDSLIYLASDLSTKRRDVLNAARAGLARIRDTDGLGLVLVPQRNFEILRAYRELLAKLLMLESAWKRPASERCPSDFGEFAWLVAFDEDDQKSFHRELLDASIQALATDSFDPVNACVEDWRMTARSLSKEKSRRVLTAPGDDLSTFEEVERPE